MTETTTRRKSGYGWKLGTFRLPTGDYQFERVEGPTEGPNDTIELVVKILGPTYIGQHVRVFVPKDEWGHHTVFFAQLDADYGIIIPATIRPIR